MNRWNYAKSVPDTLYVACSGGVDSVAASSILAEWRNVTLLHFGHADHASQHERECVYNLSRLLSVPIITKDSELQTPTSNKEMHWRNDRYEWFRSIEGYVVTAHTLNDAVEWYLMTCLRGRGEFMNYQHKNVIRPFLLTEKRKLVEYATANNLPVWEDPTNHDPNFGLRAKVRNKLLPIAHECHPGLKKVVLNNLRKKIRQSDQNG